MSIDMLLACLQMPDVMGNKLTALDKDQIISRCGEAYRLLEEQRKQINEQAAELAKLRAVLEAAKNALPHINDVTNAAYDAEQRLRQAIEAAEAGEDFADANNPPGS